jgi:hypothetical protein
MAKKNVNNINSEGGPVFTGKVDNRGGQISGRSDKYYSKNNAKKIKLQIKEYRTRIIVAIIGAVATIIAAIIAAAWPDL